MNEGAKTQIRITICTSSDKNCGNTFPQCERLSQIREKRSAFVFQNGSADSEEVAKCELSSNHSSRKRTKHGKRRKKSRLFGF